MKINNITALQEDIIDNTYVMIFPESPDMEALTPPFTVTTSDGQHVRTVEDFTVPVRKDTDLATGQTTVTFRKLSEAERLAQQVEELTEKLEAEQAFSAMFEGLSLSGLTSIGEEDTDNA